jgi:hypothetical protein
MKRILLASLAVLALAVPRAAHAQEGPVTLVEPDEADLDWMPWISDVPTVDLSGTWVYEKRGSDPLPDAWRGAPVVYEIFQQLDRIVLRLRTGGETVVQNLTWTGAIVPRNQQGMEIRERTRWADNGRTLEIDGRWWLPGETPEPQPFLYRYRLDGRDTLIVTQDDDYGSTTWRFRRDD